MISIRDSGIIEIGDISWGTHISHLYSSTKSFPKVVAPYILSGLKNNELCVWICSQNTNYKEAKDILQSTGINIDTYISRDQLRILPYTQWYDLDNSFNELRLNKQWLELVQYARENGFDGLRAVGDTAWLKKCYHRDFEVYEKKLNDVMAELPFIALCLYDMKKVSIPEVAEIIMNHTYTLITEDSELKLVKNSELSVKERQLSENKWQLDEMLKLDKLKDEFFSNISHELRTPLNIILSTIQMLKRYKTQLVHNDSNQLIFTRVRKHLNVIQQNCYRQLRLVNNLIDISKIDSGYYNLNLQNCNIIEIVENITMSVAEHIRSKGVSLVFDTNMEELIVACDPDQIERIILNLLSNSTKFTNSGGSIFINIQGNDEKVVILIKDTGEGIPQDKLECIFKRFHQVEMSLTRTHEGSGIGLSLVKSLVEKHNGKISVQSELGKGTEFLIELPSVKVQGAAPVHYLQNDLYNQHHIEKINIEFSDIYSVH